MKKLKIFFLCILLTIIFSCLVACSDNKQDITGIIFSDATFTYDGTEKKAEISGVLPDGVSVSYENNAATNAGIYNAKAVLSGENYNTLTLDCTLTIKKADITGIAFSDATFTYDGTEKKAEISGVLPDGVSVSYENNAATNAGTYNAKAVLYGENYNTLTLTATFKIKENIKNLAGKVLNSLLRMPDTESFLPEGLKLQNLVFSGSLPDFSDFVNVSSIPARGIGKQLRVMYNSIINFQSGVTYLNKINSVLNALETIYQDFLNDNPDNYAVFEGNYENFSFRIELLDTSYFAVFRFVSAALEISYDAESQTNIGKIKITDGISAKYEIKDNFIKFALQATVANVGFLSQIEFNKTANGVRGSFYEFIGAENASIKTSALIVVGEKYTSVIADKRESDDMIVEGEVEVYESQSGRFIGSEIKETLKAVDYDTMWFNLKDVQGISSVRISEERNDLNLNTVYINGSETPFLPKKVGGLSLSMLSRRFDIEMKVMYFYVFDENTGKFKEQKTEIPMLFVQRDFLDSFSEDVKEKNSNNGVAGETKITLSEAEKSFIDKIYSVLTEDYKLLKNQVTFSSVQKFLDQ